MSEVVGVRIHAAQKSVFFTIVKIKRFGRTPNTTLSIDRDRWPLAHVKVLSSTLVKLYLAGYPFSKASLWEVRIAEFGRIRLTYYLASLYTNLTFKSALLLIKKKASLAFVNFICILTPLRR